MSINNISSSIDRLVEVHDKVDIDQSVYTIEECSELIKELTKKMRGKGSYDHIIEEGCDVLTSTLILLRKLNVSLEYIEQQMLYKINRAIDRYNENKET